MGNRQWRNYSRQTEAIYPVASPERSASQVMGGSIFETGSQVSFFINSLTS